MSVLLVYIVIQFLHIVTSAATGAVAPGCSGTVNAD